jgi:hypothetical protein
VVEEEERALAAEAEAAAAAAVAEGAATAAAAAAAAAPRLPGVGVVQRVASWFGGGGGQGQGQGQGQGSAGGSTPDGSRVAALGVSSSGGGGGGGLLLTVGGVAPSVGQLLIELPPHGAGYGIGGEPRQDGKQIMDADTLDTLSRMVRLYTDKGSGWTDLNLLMLAIDVHGATDDIKPYQEMQKLLNHHQLRLTASSDKATTASEGPEGGAETVRDAEPPRLWERKIADASKLFLRHPQLKVRFDISK